MFYSFWEPKFGGAISAPCIGRSNPFLILSQEGEGFGLSDEGSESYGDFRATCAIEACTLIKSDGSKRADPKSFQILELWISEKSCHSVLCVFSSLVSTRLSFFQRQRASHAPHFRTRVIQKPFTS